VISTDREHADDVVRVEDGQVPDVMPQHHDGGAPHRHVRGDRAARIGHHRHDAGDVGTVPLRQHLQPCYGLHGEHGGLGVSIVAGETLDHLRVDHAGQTALTRMPCSV
jgi:hypothetical protein